MVGHTAVRKQSCPYMTPWDPAPIVLFAQLIDVCVATRFLYTKGRVLCVAQTCYVGPAQWGKVEPVRLGQSN